MRIVEVIDAGIAEACPRSNDAGLFSGTFTGEDHRLVASLRQAAVPGDALETLAAAAVARLLQPRAADVPADFMGDRLADPLFATAVADLSVTGEATLVDFRRAATDGVASLRGQVSERVRARIGVAPLSEALVGVADDELQGAVAEVVNRALDVLWALHGPTEHRRANREPLGWIAVDAERDPPTRPVNVPAADWPTADLAVTANHDGRDIVCRVRYAIAGASDASNAASVHDSLPHDDVPPLLPSDAQVLIFLHGHSSRLEEAGMYHTLVAEQAHLGGGRPIAMVSFDFPTHGYSQYIDHDVLSPLERTTHYVPDRPLERRFGLLEFFEKFVIAFAEALDAAMQSEGQPGILHRIVAVIGGSMGGNLALRLSERLVTRAEWLNSVVAWSPASAYPSFGRMDALVPSPEEHWDFVGAEARRRTFERCQEDEGTHTRSDFVRIQLVGERLIDDGTPAFEAVVRLLVAVLGPAVIGSSILEGFASTIAVRQSDSWLRAECRSGVDLDQVEEGARIMLNEVYSPARRRMHWRVAYEQLMFSHLDEVAASRGRACFAVSSIPTLLIAGADDITDSRFNIYDGVRTIAPQMRANSGTAVFVHATGHSIHAERPKWLAQEILKFLGRTLTLPGFARIATAVRRDDRSGVYELWAPGAAWSPIATADVIEHLRASTHPYFVQIPGGGLVPLVVVNDRDGAYLRTAPTPDEADNLAAMPTPNVKRLQCTFRTGKDDLRGGDDNLDLSIQFRDGRLQRATSVNAGAWGGYTTNMVEIGLVPPVDPEAILRIDLETTFGGGAAGDNWDMEAVSVRVIGDGVDHEAGAHGFKCFSGDDERLSLTINARPTVRGHVNRLELTFRTGDDDLRGRDDNVNLLIYLADGSVQRVDNINGSGQWAPHALSVVEVGLSPAVAPETILRIELQTTFRGGHDGDDWDMESVLVRGMGNGIDRELATHGFNRFTSDDGVLSIVINEAPTPPGHVNRLALAFQTGGDNLRGGHDNINLVIRLRDDTLRRVDNLNRGIRWDNNTSHTIEVALSPSAAPQDIVALELETTFRGGHDGDNWDMAGLRVHATGNGVDRELTTFGFRRFTGKDKILRIPIVLAEPGQANHLQCTFGTGRDDLRGGDDNVGVTINFRDGTSQRVDNLNGGGRWSRYTSRVVNINLDRAVAPTEIAGISLLATFGGGVAGDNWDMASLAMRAFGNEVDELLLEHGFKRFTGSDRSLWIPITVAGPGQANRLECSFRTGRDNLRGGSDNLNLIIRYNDTMQRVANVNGGARWPRDSSRVVTIILEEAAAPVDVTEVTLQTTFAGGIDGDNWDMDSVEMRALGNGVDEVLFMHGPRRFTGDDGSLFLRRA